MRHLCMSLLCVALAAWVMPGPVLADLMIEAEDADAFDNASVRTGISGASNGSDVQVNNPWDQKGSVFFWLDAGTLAAGDYNLTAALWSENSGRRVYSELRAGTHLTNDGNWLNPSGYAVPSSGNSAYDEVLCTTSEGGSVATVYTIASGQDYTLRIHGYLAPGGDVPYLDYIKFSAVPEPSTAAIGFISLLGLLAYAWRKRR